MGLHMEKEKVKQVLYHTRVMTLSVNTGECPWSFPVYLVYLGGIFYFFSNTESRHIIHAGSHDGMGASIFHDSDSIEEIYGLQMKGLLESQIPAAKHLVVIPQYIRKFDFIRQAFGKEAVENPDFFKDKFKSRLYGFRPSMVVASDNKRPHGKRQPVDLQAILSGEGTYPAR